MDNKTDKYISIDEAAEYLGIKTVTLRGWIKDRKKEIPAHRIGKFWKFKYSELADWAYANGEAMLMEDEPEMQDYENQ